MHINTFSILSVFYTFVMEMSIAYILTRSMCVQRCFCLVEIACCLAISTENKKGNVSENTILNSLDKQHKFLVFSLANSNVPCIVFKFE